MLWLVLKYYGVPFKVMATFSILSLSLATLIYCALVLEGLKSTYPDEFLPYGKWPTLKRKSNLPESDRRKYRHTKRILHTVPIGLMALLFGFGALARHYNW